MIDTEAPAEWIDLAADIRAVDGNHDLGAGALAAALTARGWTRKPGPDVDRVILPAIREDSTTGWPRWSTGPQRRAMLR